MSRQVLSAEVRDISLLQRLEFDFILKYEIGSCCRLPGRQVTPSKQQLTLALKYLGLIV